MLSTKKARFLCLDISNMYLNTPLDRFEYMKMHLRNIPQEIIGQYKLTNLVAPNGYVYIEIRRAMYGLKQSGFIANKQLKEVFGKAGYYASKHTPGLFLHNMRPINFTLVVDDFGVKYTNNNDALHLVNTLRANYPIKEDWLGKRYIGIDLDCDYENRTLQTCMLNYTLSSLLQFQHPQPSRSQHAPFKYSPRTYGTKTHMTKIDSSPRMNPSQRKHLDQVTGKFLYTACAIADIIMHSLNDLSTQTHSGTQKTVRSTTYFLDYFSTNPNAKKMYRASYMILKIHSDAAYLVALK